MIKFINSIANLISSIILIVVVVFIAWGGAKIYDMLTLQERMKADLEKKDRQIEEFRTKIEEQNAEIERQEARIQQLETANRLLKVERRVALVDVLSQVGSRETGDLKTKFAFVELGPDGRPLHPPKEFTIGGDLLYVDSWVIKFLDEYVELGDPLRAASLCLFRRLFGEKQAPEEGFPLDAPGTAPEVYRAGGEMTAFEQEIWGKFWEYANNPEAAREKGVRAAHGEAPSMKLVPGKRYRLELRASGGLSFVLEGDSPMGSGRPSA